jgi:hypothetical protein
MMINQRWFLLSHVVLFSVVPLLVVLFGVVLLSDGGGGGVIVLFTGELVFELLKGGILDG